MLRVMPYRYEVLWLYMFLVKKRTTKISIFQLSCFIHNAVLKSLAECSFYPNCSSSAADILVNSSWNVHPWRVIYTIVQGKRCHKLEHHQDAQKKRGEKTMSATEVSKAWNSDINKCSASLQGSHILVCEKIGVNFETSSYSVCIKVS